MRTREEFNAKVARDARIAKEGKGKEKKKFWTGLT